MQNVTAWKRLVVAAGVVLGMTVFAVPGTEARPKYATVISKTYPELTKKHGKNGKLTCAVCHPSTEKSKKKRNNYGVALTGKLGKKNETDEAKIEKAIRDTEAEKSHVDGKSFGDLIKAGDLPGEDKAAN